MRSPMSRKAYRGRKPSFDRSQLDIIRDMLAQDASPSAIAKAASVSRQVVYRVKDDPAKAERPFWSHGACKPASFVLRKFVEASTGVC